MLNLSSLQKIKYILGLLAIFFILPGAAVAVDKIAYQTNRTDSYNVTIEPYVKDHVQDPTYSAGEVLQIELKISNIGNYCLLDGILVYDMVQGNDKPASVSFDDKAKIDRDNIFSETFLPIKICPGESRILPMSSHVEAHCTDASLLINVSLRLNV